MILRYAHLAVTPDVNGPGNRLTLWVQGCRRGCPGCFNPDLQDPLGGRADTAGAIAERALAMAPWEGVSLSGGEPFDQAGPVAAFVRVLGERLGRSFDVIAFTGYRLGDLRAGARDQGELLSLVDLLIDGPYRAELPPAPPLRGSANQRCLPLTPRGARLLRRATSSRPEVAVTIGPSGEILLSGFPSPQLLRSLRSRLRAG
ncbi:4Fe-4S single cluster domain-containing protein [Deferrisoma sp.]